jgi:hypothetical protein
MVDFAKMLEKSRQRKAQGRELKQETGDAAPSSQEKKSMVDDTEELDVIELEESLSDAEKPLELPAGIYVGEIQDVQVAASQKGNPYYAVKFVIPPEEIPADIQDQFEDGAVLYWNRQIKPTARDRRALHNLRKFVEAIGLDTDTTSINPNDWMGCQARLRVRHRVYQGEKRAEIQSVEALEGAAPRAARQQEPVEEEVETRPTPRGRAASRRTR